MSNTPTVSLLRLLLALLDGQHQLDLQRREQEEAKGEARGPRLLTLRDKLRALARMRGIELTDAEVARELDNAKRQMAEDRIARGELPPVVRTPWNQAVSFLFQSVTAPCADNRDEEFRLEDEPSAAEDSLREYLLRARVGGFERPHPLSGELYRLDNTGFGNRLAEHLRQYFPAEMSAILDALGVTAVPAVQSSGEETGSRREPPPPPPSHTLYRLEESSGAAWLIWDGPDRPHKKAVSLGEFDLLEAMKAKSERPKEEVLHEIKTDEQRFNSMQHRLNKKLRGWDAPFHFRGGQKQLRVKSGVYEPRKVTPKSRQKRQKPRQKRQKPRQ